MNAWNDEAVPSSGFDEPETWCPACLETGRTYLTAHPVLRYCRSHQPSLIGSHDPDGAEWVPIVGDGADGPRFCALLHRPQETEWIIR